jgi:hypothetical protein
MREGSEERTRQEPLASLGREKEMYMHAYISIHTYLCIYTYLCT